MLSCPNTRVEVLLRDDIEKAHRYTFIVIFSTELRLITSPFTVERILFIRLVLELFSEGYQWMAIYFEFLTLTLMNAFKASLGCAFGIALGTTAL